MPLNIVTNVDSLITLAKEAEFQADEETFVDTAYSSTKPMDNAKVIVTAVNPP